MGTDATLNQDELEESRDELGDEIIPETKQKPDLDVDGWESSLFARIRKYLDPNNK